MIWYTGQTYATVWDVNKIGGGGVSVKFSTSEKKPDGTYKNSNWDGVGFKEVAEILKEMGRGDRFIMKTAKIEVRPYEKDGKTFYPTSITLIDIDPVSSNTYSRNKGKTETQKTKYTSKKPAPPVDDDDDEDSPW